MRRAICFAALTASAWAGQPIREYVLDRYKAVDLGVSREVTAITLPAPITAVVGSEMLIDNGGGTEVDETAHLRFHVTHPAGSNFVLVRSLMPAAEGRLTLLFEESAYVLQLRSTEEDSTASLILRRADVPEPERVGRAPEPVRFTPRIGLSLLDRARAYPVLAQSLPKAVAGVTRSVQGRIIELPDLEITIDEVIRFQAEDAMVFLLTLRNTGETTLDVAPSTFAARVGDYRFTQAIANGPRSLAPGEATSAEFAIVGLPDGQRNDLSADNAFTILVNTSRRQMAAQTGAEEPTS
jgi:hypothetical protein